MSATFPITDSERAGGTRAHVHQLRESNRSEASALHPRDLSGSGWIEALRDPDSHEVVDLQFPLRIDFSLDPDHTGLLVEAPLLGLAGSGETYREALDDLADSVFFLRSDLENEPSDRLTDGALLLRDRLRALVA